MSGRRRLEVILSIVLLRAPSTAVSEVPSKTTPCAEDVKIKGLLREAKGQNAGQGKTRVTAAAANL